MHYFEKFPIRPYPIGDGKTISVTDIFAKAVFNNQSKESLSLLEDFPIGDGDTPDSLAEELYGDSTLGWIILLFNDIFDPHFDWALSLRGTERNVKDNHPGNAMFIHAVDDITQPVFPNIKINDTILQYTHADGVTFTGVRGLVYDYDTTLQRILVHGITGGTFGDGDYVKSMRDAGTSSDIFTIGKHIEETWNGLDHFENSTGDILNPLSQWTGTESIPIGTGDDGYSDGVSYDNCLIQNYISGESSVEARTIFETAMHHYDTKRTIKILKKDYIPNVIEAMESVMNG